MGNINFFAAKDDIRALMDFVSALPGVRIFEMYSRNDCELREFRTFDDLCAAFAVGSDELGNGAAIDLQLHSDAVLGPVEFRRKDFNSPVPGHAKFRYALVGLGLMPLCFGGIHRDTLLTYSYFGVLTEAAAQKYGGDKRNINWVELKKVAAKIQSFIKTKLAAAKAAQNFVLPAALQLHDQGLRLQMTARQESAFAIERLPRKQ